MGLIMFRHLSTIINTMDTLYLLSLLSTAWNKTISTMKSSVVHILSGIYDLPIVSSVVQSIQTLTNYEQIKAQMASLRSENAQLHVTIEGLKKRNHKLRAQLDSIDQQQKHWKNIAKQQKQAFDEATKTLKKQLNKDDAQTEFLQYHKPATKSTSRLFQPSHSDYIIFSVCLVVSLFFMNIVYSVLYAQENL
eukprot:168771_1